MTLRPAVRAALAFTRTKPSGVTVGGGPAGAGEAGAGALIGPVCLTSVEKTELEVRIEPPAPPAAPAAPTPTLPLLPELVDEYCCFWYEEDELEPEAEARPAPDASQAAARSTTEGALER